MHKITTTLGCFLLAGAAFAQQASTPAPASATPKAAGPIKQAPAGPAHPLTDAQAQEMLAVTGADKIKAEMTQSMLAYFQARAPFLPKDVTDDLQQSFQKMDLSAPIVAIYKQHISAEDATNIIAFYKTPAGKNLMNTLPDILQQSQMASMQLGQKTVQEVMARHRPEIEAAAKQYQQEHAPKPAPAGTTPAPQSSSSTPSPKSN
jgi:hypothetical protein